MFDAIFEFSIGGFRTIIIFGVMLVVSYASYCHFEKTENKFFLSIQAIFAAVVLASMLTFPKYSSDNSDYEDVKIKSNEEQIANFCENLGSCIALIFVGSRLLSAMVDLYNKREKNN